MTIIRNTPKFTHGRVEYKKKNYELMSYHPNAMLIDETISWEAKGYLSYIVFNTFNRDLQINIKTIKELIKAGYLVEVKE